MTTAWLAPTARATSWRPLAAVATGLALTSVAALAIDEWPPHLSVLAAAAVAAGVVSGLQDVAAALLSAVPTSPALRRARRLALLVPAGLAVWLAYALLARQLVPGAGWYLGPVAALTMTGLAVAVWAPTGNAVAVGAVVPLAWVGVALLSGIGGPAADALFLWRDHPWPVVLVAVIALLGRREL